MKDRGVLFGYSSLPGSVLALVVCQMGVTNTSDANVIFSSKHHKVLLVWYNQYLHKIEPGDVIMEQYEATVESDSDHALRDDLLTFLAQTSSMTPDEPFFNKLARYLAKCLNMDFVCIDRLEGDGLTATTVAVWSDDHFEDNVSYALKDTPCGDVVGNAVCCFPDMVCQLFPKDQVLKDLRAEGYIGVTLWSHTGKPIGLIAAISRNPLVNRQLAETIMKIVAVRAAGEIERMDTEASLRESEESLRFFFEYAPASLAMFDNEMCYLQVSQRWLNDYGLGNRNLTGLSHYEVFPEVPDKWKEAHRRGLAGEVLRDEDCFVRASGQVQWIRWEIRPWYKPDNVIGGIVIFSEDVTEYKKSEQEKILLEQQFQHAQKLESLGVLAGGIAHDFNNILAIIMGNCSLAKLDSENAEVYIPEIEKATDRAAALCRQMLAYAGKAQLTRLHVNMRLLVDEMINMLKSTLPQNTVLKPNLSTDLPLVNGDASQLRQIVMNLIINASEAIGDSQGEISIYLTKKTISARQGEKDHQGKEIPPGEYVCLEVMDNGCGMSEETKWRIFEPFYTTKFTGRGLGMSAVLGILSAHSGALQLFSQSGEGTVFKVYLPGEPSGVEPLAEPASSMSWYGSGTILLVEDEEQIRVLAHALLTKLGFEIIEATNGREALEKYQINSSNIALVITDMGMPVMDGYELFRALKKLDPDLPIIVSSGFGDSVISSRLEPEVVAGLVSKPYKFDQLREVLKSVLGG